MTHTHLKSRPFLLVTLIVTSVFSIVGFAYSSTAATTISTDISTGNITASGNLTVSGNVGIGTASPNNILSVYDLIDFNNTDFNTKLGYQAGKNIVAGALSNTFIGFQAGLASSTASTNVADNNTAIGYQSLYFNTTGSNNSVIGYQSLYSNTDGSYNSAIGSTALYTNTTGNYNSTIGYQSLRYNTTGSNNSAIGYRSLYKNTSGKDNSAVGIISLAANTTGDYNSAIGYGSLSSNTTGSDNSAMGDSALYFNGSATSTVAIGAYSAQGSDDYSNQFGTYVGYQSGYSVQTGSDNNTFLGYGSGYANTSGANNLLLGYQAGDNITSGSNNIVIGYDINAPSATASNQLNIGGLIYGDTALGRVGIGTTTPFSQFQVTAGASATTTVNFGEVGSATSHACFNTKNTAGTDISFYFVGTGMIVESNLCR